MVSPAPEETTAPRGGRVLGLWDSISGCSPIPKAFRVHPKPQLACAQENSAHNPRARATSATAQFKLQIPWQRKPRLSLAQGQRLAGTSSSCCQRPLAMTSRALFSG